jgi:hypothetical protein
VINEVELPTVCVTGKYVSRESVRHVRNQSVTTTHTRDLQSFLKTISTSALLRRQLPPYDKLLPWKRLTCSFRWPLRGTN